ncbi:MAG: hypothetical protein RIQ33_64 [Bacteroidota bacterium]|jgi:hypothetical protein
MLKIRFAKIAEETEKGNRIEWKLVGFNPKEALKQQTKSYWLLVIGYW